MDETLHFRILDDIARDLSGDVNFPTCMDAAVLVRNTLRDPCVTTERIVRAIGVEPLISSKLLRLANSVGHNPSGEAIHDLSTAVARLGSDVVRTTSLAVALDQMLKSRQSGIHAPLARQTWELAIQVAAIARVLARRLGRINPDEAMLAGLVHNIGSFYLLYRSADYPEYADEASIQDLLAHRQASIGESLLHLLGLPERIVEAVRDQDSIGDASAPPCRIADTLYFARQLAANALGKPQAGMDDMPVADYADLLNEAEGDIHELRAALAG